MVIGQNRHLRQRTLSPGQAVIVVVGGVITGLAAGAAGQSVFYIVSGEEEVAAIGRVVAWAMLGTGLGVGMGFFVPNLNRKRAAVAGAAGGAIAAFCFLTLVPATGDTTGRLLGAAILGLSAGLTTVLVETANRKAWLVVHWSAKERSTLSLGPSPILVGSSSRAHILVGEDVSPVPIAARISLADCTVHLEDGASGDTRALRDGEVLTYGHIRIQVRATRAAGPEVRPVEKRSGPEPRAPRDVPASAKRARAREAKWYDAEVPSIAKTKTRDR